MSRDKKKSSEEAQNNWITPTVIAAVIGLIGTLVTLYVGYLKDTRPLELAATQTADARIFQLTVAVLTPSPANPPTLTPVPPSPTATQAPTSIQVPATSTFTPTITRTLPPEDTQFCINTRSANVRAGPGTDYGVIGYLNFQDCLYFDGRNVDATWLHILDDQDKYTSLNGGWVRADLVRPQDFTNLPLVELPTATPTPEG